ncbi:dehydratase [Desertihabitans brevis]|uniref:Dehydratase n=1 Tax=Desertihabitans brevis TaxID=2268447 RepID=A0A367YV13_9ACTN|nr:MaoC/PaaZ C-terminal domain-containing protein [Desertihabitans brevis]RCK69704.1 dehydratase [Desertihabitans brevis]
MSAAATVTAEQAGAGTELPATTVHLTRADLIRYAGASGDFNPIHWSDRFATAIGMPGVVAHGMLTMALAVKAVTDWVGDPSTVRVCSTRFTRPVVVDELDGADVTFTGSVSAVEGTRLTVTVQAVCEDVKVLGPTRVEVDLG